MTSGDWHKILVDFIVTVLSSVPIGFGFAFGWHIFKWVVTDKPVPPPFYGYPYDNP